MQALEAGQDDVNNLNKSGEMAINAVSAVLGDPSPVQEELAALNTKYNALKQRLGDRELELEKAVNDGAQLQDTLGAISVWVVATLEAVDSWETISTDPDTAKKQLEETEVRNQ